MRTSVNKEPYKKAMTILVVDEVVLHGGEGKPTSPSPPPPPLMVRDGPELASLWKKKLKFGELRKRRRERMKRKMIAWCV